jgi:hypothetical protein
LGGEGDPITISDESGVKRVKTPQVEGRTLLPTGLHVIEEEKKKKDEEE